MITPDFYQGKIMKFKKELWS